MFYFPFYGEPEHNNLVNNLAEEMIRRNRERLEEQGRVFLRMGFREEELCIIKEEGKPDQVELKVAFGIKD